MNTETIFYKILKNITSIGLSDFINKGVLFLFNVVVARYLPVKEYGLFSLSISVGIYLWSVADAGVTAHVTKMTAQLGRQNLNNIISFAIPIRLSLSLLVILALGVGLFFVRVSFYESLVYLSAILYLIAMSLFPAWIMRGLQDNLGYFVVYIFLSSFVGFFLVLWVKVDVISKNALSAIFFRNFGCFIGSLFGLLWTIRRLKFKINIQDLYFDFKILKTTYSLCIAAILYSLIPLIPQIALRFFGSLEDLGNYGAIWQFQRLLLGGALVFSSSFMPMIAKYYYKNDHKTLKRIFYNHFKLLLIVILLIFVFYNLLFGKILYLFYGKTYHFSTLLIILFSLLLIIFFLRASIDSILIGLNKYYLMASTGLIVILFLIIIVLIALIFNEINILICTISYLMAEFALLILNSFFAIALLFRSKKIN